MGRTVKGFRFLCSTLNDPRRIRLHEDETLQAYEQRGTSDDLSEIGYDLTKLRRADTAKLVGAMQLFQEPSMQEVLLAHDRAYPLNPCITLPKPKILDHPFHELISSRRSIRNFSGNALCIPELSSLLLDALGETGRLITSYDDDRPFYASLRSIPSAGALHPTDLFVVILQGGLAQGVYHYDVPEHLLEFVKALSEREIKTLFAAFPIHPQVVDLAKASAIFFISSKFWRARAKYGPRGYRYCLLEAGCACQNLSLASVALGLAHVVLGGFYDDEVHAFLGMDGVEHAVIVAMAVGGLVAEPAKESHDVEF